jgi:hypothetical protein
MPFPHLCQVVSVGVVLERLLILELSWLRHVTGPNPPRLPAFTAGSIRVLALNTGGLFVSVRFSDHRWFPIFVRFLVIILIFIVDIIVVLGVPRWHRANQGARYWDGRGSQGNRTNVDRCTFDGRSSS